jgi:hypothetical protein
VSAWITQENVADIQFTQAPKKSHENENSDDDDDSIGKVPFGRTCRVCFPALMIQQFRSEAPTPWDMAKNGF